jgi:5-formyltetrahydrofolate cyclo-ligase
MTKQELRQLYKAKRAQLDPKECLRLDDLILLQFQQLNYSDIQTVLTYWPMPDQVEPNTHLFSSYLRHMIPGLTLAYPFTDTSARLMTALAINEDTVYHTNHWNITEPKEGVVVQPGRVDMVFVPLLVCDKIGYRVGYGKGFYDRYLSACREDIVKIGFSYFEPIEKITDTDQFDIPLTYCITPQNVYEF